MYNILLTKFDAKILWYIIYSHIERKGLERLLATFFNLITNIVNIAFILVERSFDS